MMWRGGDEEEGVKEDAKVGLNQHWKHGGNEGGKRAGRRRVEGTDDRWVGRWVKEGGKVGSMVSEEVGKCAISLGKVGGRCDRW